MCASWTSWRRTSSASRSTHYRGQMSEMARKLGIGRSTLYRKMKDYGLADENSGGGANAA